MVWNVCVNHSLTDSSGVMDVEEPEEPNVEYTEVLHLQMADPVRGKPKFVIIIKVKTIQLWSNELQKEQRERTSERHCHNYSPPLYTIHQTGRIYSQIFSFPKNHLLIPVMMKWILAPALGVFCSFGSNPEAFWFRVEYIFFPAVGNLFLLHLLFP